jgi:rod shape-determining protein MreD
MTSPRTYSVGSAWVIGLVLDVAQGTLLGQHALALCLVIYITVKFHLQLRQFPTLQLTATVFAMLALYQFILFWINGVAGVNTVAVSYWGPVISGMLLWPLLSMMLGSLRFRGRR